MRRKIKTVMEQMNAEKPDDVLADLERKHGSQQRFVRRCGVCKKPIKKDATSCESCGATDFDT